MDRRNMHAVVATVITMALVSAVHAQTPSPTPVPSPGEIVAAAPASDWTAIAASDLLVMDLAPGPRGPRRVIIQLMPAPFSQGWIGNIRKLAAAQWWDGTSVNRVQDNYVVQWGDATEKKALPEGLVTVAEADYTSSLSEWQARNAVRDAERQSRQASGPVFRPVELDPYPAWHSTDAYSSWVDFHYGWPIGATGQTWEQKWSPVHCYAMVGVGRNFSPDTGSGAELYTVIGHAPRHLDRNIALVGRVIEGIEHLSSLPRGTGALGFYEKEEERVPIVSVRMGTEIADLPAFEYLSTESATFAKYADARANRRDPFFNVPAGGADICNIPVPVRRRAP
jgi:cyclophilin family peptidyl-prolyl cis-trans isomerase